MAKGYVPVFSSVFDGTLGGRWPDSGVWLCLLALADADGTIDMTPHAISARIGVPVEQLRECLQRFSAPDPESRSPEEEGRRLVPIDTGRSWGWRVVNMAAYRRKASQRNEAADGKVAERVRRHRERQKITDGNGALRHVTASHGTETETDTETEKKIGQTPSAFDRFWSAYPKRVKRKTAQEIWKRKRLESKAEELLADIAERSKSDRRWLEGFIPDPTTYLNQERWTDEREAPKTTGIGNGLPFADL